MSDPNLSAAQKRLNALLRDEEYGPKLVRLNRTDERVILDMIYENRGREARKELNKLDEQRRVYRTTRGHARTYAKLSTDQRSRQWQQIKRREKNNENEFWRLYRAAVLAS